MDLYLNEFTSLERKPYKLCLGERFNKFGQGLKSHPNFLAGFTLIELMAVIAIIFIITSVGVISFNQQLPHYRLKGDAQSIVSSLTLARMKATSTGLEHAVEFDLDANPQLYTLQQGDSNSGSSVWSDQTYSKRLSPTVAIAQVVDNGGAHSSGIARIIYSPTGSSGTGQVFLGSVTDGYKITLTPATGRIQTAKGWS